MFERKTCILSPSLSFLLQMEFDEKELRKEISYAIKNIHGIRHVRPPTHPSIRASLPLYSTSLSLSISVTSARQTASNLLRSSNLEKGLYTLPEWSVEY